MAKITISNNIRSLRFNHAEMTQQDLANRTGVTRQTIVAIENGKYYPSLELAYSIAIVFNTSLDQVFWYAIKPEEKSASAQQEGKEQ